METEMQKRVYDKTRMNILSNLLTYGVVNFRNATSRHSKQ